MDRRIGKPVLQELGNTFQPIHSFIESKCHVSPLRSEACFLHSVLEKPNALLIIIT